MVVTRSARPQACVQATSSESSGQKVGNSTAPHFCSRPRRIAPGAGGGVGGGAAPGSG